MVYKLYTLDQWSPNVLDYVPQNKFEHVSSTLRVLMYILHTCTLHWHFLYITEHTQDVQRMR